MIIGTSSKKYPVKAAGILGYDDSEDNGLKGFCRFAVFPAAEGDRLKMEAVVPASASGKLR